MKKKRNVKEKVTSKTTKMTSILDSNWIVRITALVIIIPLVIVAVLLLTSMGGSGEPVVGDRFENHLVNEISDAKVTELEKSLKFENVEAVQVNLKSATLRILIDTEDLLSNDDVKSIAKSAYTQVTSLLPVNTYFTNQVKGEETIKMYDLEIHVYNLIPENDEKQIYGVYYKNASSEKSGFDWITTPRNEEVVKDLLDKK